MAVQASPSLKAYLLLLISMLWHRQAIFESKGDKLSSSAEGRIRTQGLRYLFTSRLNACWQTIVHYGMRLFIHSLISDHECMMTSSNRDTSRVTGPLWGENSPHKAQWRGALMFSLIMNKRLSKPSRFRWFETISRPLRPRCNEKKLRNHK